MDNSNRDNNNKNNCYLLPKLYTTYVDILLHHVMS